MLWPRLFVIGIIALFIGAPVGAIWVKRAGPRRLKAIIDSINRNLASEPQVVVQFTTYHGLIAFVEQTRHELRLPQSEARRVLKAFRRFNLTWGLFSYGMLFIPLLTVAEYRSQLRSIDEQVRQAQDAGTEITEAITDGNPYRPPQTK